METEEEKEEKREENNMTKEEIMLEEKREEKMDMDTQNNTIIELLNEFCSEKTPIFINGLGIGKILKVRQEYVKFEVIREEEKDKKKKNKSTGKMDTYKEKTLFKEATYIPLRKIETISEGEKEVPKTEDETKIDEDLGNL